MDVQMYGWTAGRTNNHEFIWPLDRESKLIKRVISKTEDRKGIKIDTWMD